MRRFGLAIGLTDDDFDDGIMIFECVAHTASDHPRHARRRAGGNPRRRAGQRNHGARYSDEFDAALEKHYGLDSRARTFFAVHGKVDVEHTAMAADTVAKFAITDRDKEMVRVAAKNMVRFKLAKFDGIYDTYA